MKIFINLVYLLSYCALFPSTQHTEQNSVFSTTFNTASSTQEMLIENYVKKHRRALATISGIWHLKQKQQKTSTTISNVQASANQRHDQQNEKATNRMGENTYRSYIW